MFDDVQRDLCHLLELVQKAENFDATLAARPEIEPSQGAYDERCRKGLEITALKLKYHL